MRADDFGDKPTEAQVATARAVWLERIFDRDLFEKVALLALLITIFSSVLPTMATRPITITLQVLFMVTINTVASVIWPKLTIRTIPPNCTNSRSKTICRKSEGTSTGRCRKVPEGRCGGGSTESTLRR